MNRTMKRIISVVTALSMCVAMIGIMPVMAADSAFSGGSGTQADPLLISSEADLIQFGYNVSQGNTYAGKYVKLTQDITLTKADETATNGNPKNFIPIGRDYTDGDHKPFEGIFDGDGHKVSGFDYDSNLNGGYFYTPDTGFFMVNGGTIKNLSVEGNLVAYASDVPMHCGGIVGHNFGIVENCHFSGSISYNLQSGCIAPNGNCVGGVVGRTSADGAINNCSNTADINVDYVAADIHVGGILGATESLDGLKCSVYNSYNTGTITVQGTVTDSQDGTVYQLQTANVGGIIGRSGFCDSCFNAGSILVKTEQTPSVGELIGCDGDLNNCYYWYGTIYHKSIIALSDDGGSWATVSDNGATAKTPEEFASGEVAYLLNNSSSTGNLAWYQTLGANGDAIPMLDSSHGIVCYDAGSGTYSNADPSEITTSRNIYVDFMGVGDSPGEGKKSGSLDSTNIEDTFWVGVAVDKVNDLNLFTDGVYSLELAFEYNPDFVRPDIKDSSGSTTGTETEKDDRWNTKIANANIGSETDKIWNSDYVSFAVYDSEIDQNADRADKDLLNERQNWKMCTVSVTLTEQDVQNLSFKGLSSPDKQYLLKLPFTLVGVPEDGAADPNPIVLSLIRGPETFDIGSGSNGETPNAKWNETENQGAANNLKTHFNFAGDVHLFGESVSIEDITPFRMVPKLDSDGNPMKDTNEKVIEEEETYTLSHDNTLSKEGFDPSVDTYYLSISNDPDNLQLRIKTDSQPYIYLNGSSTPISTTSITGGFVTAVIPLKELDVSTKDQDNGFNNTISIRDDPSSTESLYTIYVRRLLKPKIELNYGNSPYGMIMNESTWDDAKKEQAKTSFNSANRFSSSYLPSGASTKLYSPKAWNNSIDSEINLDRNDYSIFIYNKKPFKDPGFKAVDSMGDTIQDEKITRSIIVDRMPANNFNAMKDDNVIKETIKITDKTSQYTFTELSAGKSIRPGVYDMSYSFNDTKTGETITAIRKVVLLWTLGDADLSTIRNAADSSSTTSYVKGVSRPLTGVNSITGNLYLYRIIDADKSGIINAADASTITSIVKGVAKPEEFYKNLN